MFSIWRGYIVLASWLSPAARPGHPFLHVYRNIHVLMNALAYVNDGMNVNMWQDVFVTEPTASQPAGQDRHPVSNVELLKALADPLRLNMLYALTRGAGQDLPVMSVKELAAALGEPQTKLYRHVKHLEAAGLVKAVSSRVVSGIVEQRYQATQSRLIAGDGLTDEERDSPEAEAMAAAALETFRRKFFEAPRPGRDGAAAPIPSLTSARSSPCPMAGSRPPGPPPSASSSAPWPMSWATSGRREPARPAPWCRSTC